MDCTVLFLAFQMDAMVLSSDKVVRNYAKKKSIDYHGMLWIFDVLIVQNCITAEMAGIKFRQLMSSNYIYQNNTVLLLEMNKRLKKWSGE